MPILKHILAAIMLTAAIATAACAQSGISLEGQWRIDGTPLGTERALDPYLALTEDRLFISGTIEIDGNRRQVIQAFDAKTGAYVQTIEDPNGEVFAGHGDVIAANEKYIVTTNFRGGISESGMLQIFDAASGEHLSTIPNPRPKDSAYFGQLPIALMGNKIIAGVAFSRDNQSTVWIFDAETGDITLTIKEPDNKPKLRGKAQRTIFGSDKALTQTHALIGASLKDLGKKYRVGAAYLYDATNGDLLHTFRPTNPEVGMMFGRTLALSDTTAFISGLRDSGPMDWPVEEITAYDLATGQLKYTLTDPHIPQTAEAVLAGEQGSGFGFDFIVSGNLLIVGLPDLTVGGTEKMGAIHIYDAETGELLKAHENTSGTPNEQFGTALAINAGHLAIVSTPELEPFKETTRVSIFALDR